MCYKQMKRNHTDFSSLWPHLEFRMQINSKKLCKTKFPLNITNENFKFSSCWTFCYLEGEHWIRPTPCFFLIKIFCFRHLNKMMVFIQKWWRGNLGRKKFRKMAEVKLNLIIYSYYNLFITLYRNTKYVNSFTEAGFQTSEFSVSCKHSG